MKGLVIALWLVAAGECLAQWPQWGRTAERNNVALEQELSLDWEIVYERGGKFDRRIGPLADLAESKGVRWSARVSGSGYRGMHSPSPAISGGKVFVASQNEAGRIERYKDQDYALMLCLKESDGGFLWQHSNKRLEIGKVSDWEWCEVGSTPYVEGDRLWYVSNRCEVFCLDVEGFHDGENDGVTSEEHSTMADADVIWSLDLRAQLGVFPHNYTSSSITCAGDLVFLNSGNGVNWDHKTVVSSDAPSFLALDKRTGEVVWKDSSPGKNILHGSWSSPAYGVFDGVPQVIFGGGDGWVYSFAPKGDGEGGSKLLWKFDCNLKRVKKEGYDPTLNTVISFPVVHDGLVYVATGMEPEEGRGVGRLVCIDPARHGDVSSELGVDRANPNSALRWSDEKVGRSCGSPVIADGLLAFVAYDGTVHCLDAKTGKAHWRREQASQVYGSPLIADGHLYVPSEDGELNVFKFSAEHSAAKPVKQFKLRSMMYAAPIAVGGTLYLRDANALFAIGD